MHNGLVRHFPHPTNKGVQRHCGDLSATTTQEGSSMSGLRRGRVVGDDEDMHADKKYYSMHTGMGQWTK